MTFCIDNVPGINELEQKYDSKILHCYKNEVLNEKESEKLYFKRKNSINNFSKPRDDYERELFKRGFIHLDGKYKRPSLQNENLDSSDDHLNILD